MATLAVADVHGQLGPLRRLLAQARSERADKIVFVGDLVGRGPAGADVLRAAMELGDAAAVVLGNHDLTLLRGYYCGAPLPADLDEIASASDADALCGWLRGQQLLHCVASTGALVVHAGLWADWTPAQAAALAAEVGRALQGSAGAAALDGMYGSEQLFWDDGLRGHARLQALVNLFTRVRVCRPGGGMDLSYRGMPGESPPAKSVPWFDLPGRQTSGRLVVCGHWSALGLFVREDVAMIDAGCCFGGPLAGFWVEDRQLVFDR